MVFAYDDVVWRPQGRQLRREDRYKVQESKKKLTSKSINYNPQGCRTHFRSHCLQPGYNGGPSGDAGALHHGAKHILGIGVRAAKEGHRARWSSCSLSAISCQRGEPVNKQHVWDKSACPNSPGDLKKKKKEPAASLYPPNLTPSCLCGHFNWKHSKREILGSTVYPSQADNVTKPLYPALCQLGTHTLLFKHYLIPKWRQ